MAYLWLIFTIAILCRSKMDIALLIPFIRIPHRIASRHGQTRKQITVHATCSLPECKTGLPSAKIERLWGSQEHYQQRLRHCSGSDRDEGYETSALANLLSEQAAMPLGIQSVSNFCRFVPQFLHLALERDSNLAKAWQNHSFEVVR